MEKQERIVYQQPNSSSEVDWRFFFMNPEMGMNIKIYQVNEGDETNLNGYIVFNNLNLLDPLMSKSEFQVYLYRFLKQIGFIK